MKIQFKKVCKVPCSVIKFPWETWRDIAVQKNYAIELLFSLNVR